MAKVNKNSSVFGWYPDWLLNWMTGSVDCSANDWDESVEHLNTYYKKVEIQIKEI